MSDNFYNDYMDDECYGYNYDYFENDYEIFEDKGGISALRKATERNPRNLPCPTCGEPDMLTGKDMRLGYQCDRCADRLERGGY